MNSAPVHRRAPWHHARAMLVLLVGLQGCTAYEPLPLNNVSVDAALEWSGPETLRLQAGALHHPTLEPIDLNFSDGLSPDEAAVVAVLANPELRAKRDERGITQAQLIQAGLLPNPQLSANLDPVIGGATAGTFTGWGAGLDFDLNALITHNAELSAAQHEAASVELDISWQEWQTAEDAKLHVVRLASMQTQFEEASGAVRLAETTANNLHQAMQRALITRVEVEAADADWQRLQVVALEVQDEMETERLALNQSIGLPAETRMAISPCRLPSVPVQPSPQQIAADLENHRLDLVALRWGYQSQEEKLRAAVLSQIPKITVGLAAARDTSDVVTLGPTITLDLPLFDRGQGRIAVEKATRQQLFDEYVARTFEARATIARLYAQLAAVAQRIRAADAYVEKLQSLHATYSQAVQQGDVDIISLSQIQNNLADARIEALKLRQQQAELIIGLEVEQGFVIQRPAP